MKTIVRIAIALFLLLIIAGLLFYFIVYNKPHVNYEVEKPEIEILAKDLYADFVKNSLSASKKYNGKVLQVSGVVDFIEEVEEMRIAVMVFEDGFFGPEGVRFSLLNSQAQRISVGKKVTLKGFCTGFTESDVIIEHASVVTSN